MSTELIPGVELLHERPGSGAAARQGSSVVYNARLFLRKGDEVTRDEGIIARARGQVETRRVDSVELIDHVTELGKRRPIAGVEQALYGMQAGGYREIMVAPHLAYGKRGVDELIPPDAMLRVQLWVHEVTDAPEAAAD